MGIAVGEDVAECGRCDSVADGREPLGETEASEVCLPKRPQATPSPSVTSLISHPTTELTYGMAINEALRCELSDRLQAVVYGEDVAVPGGVFGVTRGLLKEFGAERVFDAPIAESAILGSAVGASDRGVRGGGRRLDCSAPLPTTSMPHLFGLGRRMFDSRLPRSFRTLSCRRRRTSFGRVERSSRTDARVDHSGGSIDGDSRAKGDDVSKRLPWAAGLAAALSVLAVTGCAAGSEKATESPGTDTLAVGLPNPRTGPIRVGLVPQAGRPTEYNALAIKGLQDAIERLRVRGRVVEPASASDYLAVMSRFGEMRYDLVISVGSQTAAATRLAAQRFPSTMFAIVNYAFPPRRALPNIEGLVFDEAQAGYLVGYVAGSMSRTRVMSTITGPGAAAQRFVRGFRSGATATRRRVRILTASVPTDATPALCRRVALAQITRGSDVVFPAAGSCNSGALEAAAERRVWGIGIDTDQASLGPHILTSAVKYVDVAVFDAIQGVANGAVEDSFGTMSPYGFHGGGVTVYGVQYRGVGLGRVSPKVPPDLLARIDVIKRRMTGGAIVINESS
jgi:basic membrane protein A and related proteins